MKIMALNRILGETIIQPIITDILPDSAAIKDNKPFFIPDFSSEWKMEATLAYRINRLGKNVASKFAHRYYDAFTIALRSYPIDIIRTLKADNRHSAISTAFDGAIILGQWIPIPADKKITDFTLNGELYTINTQDSDINNAIAELSRFFTLKIGDVAIVGSTTHNFSPVIDSTVTATLNGKECLNFRIK